MMLVSGEIYTDCVVFAKKKTTTTTDKCGWFQRAMAKLPAMEGSMSLCCLTQLPNGSNSTTYLING